MMIFGILNVTSDSFSDGGEFLDQEKAERKGMELISCGASVLDISAQSSNVNAIQIDPNLEWSRLENLISKFKELGYKISVDTYKPFVIERSILAKVDYINNINSFRDEESLAILNQYKSSIPNLVLMYSHNNGDKAAVNSNLSPENIMGEIYRFFDNKISQLQKINIPEDKMIFDPGMGLFLGSDPMLSMTVLKNINQFKNRYGRVLVSVSRKSFIGNLLGGIPPKERGAGTLALEMYLYEQNIDYIRTHDVRQLQQALEIRKSLN
ncbi:MAG TPA: dihydropteroate synthase [Leptospiraceae bacterium]|nr:dihydropteroate synthase [Leptospiraceae bacterium]HMZ64392.1 dihydropteroate synthase [Leptospiraceae bacterium]HNA05634.1 dihydropteroate synthase [Leptospiraceae bacterium]HNB98109.1 dihydropteroate synthase [Leptospiraceae bacterium]HNC56120.1 dihydropteroate synthase [Leptospiraceae bacterium]